MSVVNTYQLPNINSVSYTHLDVYKRQDIDSENPTEFWNAVRNVKKGDGSPMFPNIGLYAVTSVFTPFIRKYWESIFYYKPYEN